ncbi:putative bifunctional diguanylate cyclase/phosphodiesterase [Thiocapsa bogorovii]|uniref:putative bifunctional diguanylate cyclase/phosphodiesterase n=1 Tax=Thiocapsa bogorovii TaxID=521689 RepID=UPI001E46086D|nr:EAL domain-containing protein [Thiocapsa bogorovii]UHD18296.1 EAL domain-containing protein [Thiocapsa bogorovii]
MSDPKGKKGRSRRWLLAPTIAGGVALVVYLALLLVTTWVAQERLSHSAAARHALDAQLHANALSYFYAERLGDLANLRRDQAVQSFFVNRDLGMSMKYGLQASLVSIRELLIERVGEKRVDSGPFFDRIVLFDADGSILVDTGADPPPSERWALRERGAPTQVRLVVDVSDHPDAILVEAPILIAGRARGTLVAWVNERTTLAALVGFDPGGSGFARYRLLRSAEELTAMEGAAGAPVEVSGTPFLLVDRAGASLDERLLTSRWFLFALVVLAVALLVGGWMLLGAQRQNLVLQTRMDVARDQRRKLSEHNERLRGEIKKRKEYERRLIYQANYDSLTSLPNRTLAMDRLEQSLMIAARDGHRVLVFYLDLDHFKRVNDSLGHAAGDEVLIQTAERVSSLVSAGDTLARLAADEFLVIYPDLRDPVDAAERAQALLDLFAAPFSIEGRELFLTVTLGVAMSPHDGKSAEDLLKNADLAMKEGKDSGRARYSFYVTGLDVQIRERLSMANLLRHAAERGELALLYQPLIDLRSGRVVAAEALLRWTSEELGTVAPDLLVPVAEDAGLIQQIGGWVLQRACAAAARWQSIAPCRVAVNVSSLQLQAPESFSEQVELALQRSGLNAGLLELEITEGVLLRDRPTIGALLAGLDRRGIRLSLDDFGTGYSALSYLRRFPFHVLKIDRSFIAGIPDNQEDTELTRAIIAMAQALDLSVLAEGVERPEQRDFLLEQGCDLAQGYLFSRPIDANGLGAMLARQRETPRS